MANFAKWNTGMVPIAPTILFNHLRKLAGGKPDQDMTDGELLSRFVACHDEVAFAVLVERHGNTVFNVCQRVLRHAQDAEDAFQGTFLLLAQQARSIQNQESIASWLYKVAHRLALGLRSRIARRHVVETRAESMNGTDPGMRAAWDELQSALDEELERLPPKYHAPLVLCYLEGLTHEEVGRRLGCPLGTINSRMARGRELLKGRLERRGLTLPAATLPTVFMAKVAQAVPPRLLRATCAAAVHHAAGQTIPVGLVTAQAVALARSGAAAMAAGHLKVVLGVLLVVGAVVFGAGRLFPGLQSSEPGDTQSEVPEVAPSRSPHCCMAAPHAKSEEPNKPQEHVDGAGDALPPTALARIGSNRLWIGRGRDTDFRCTLTFTPDSQHVAIAGANRSVVIWDALTGKETARLADVTKTSDPCPPPVFTFSPDGTLMAAIEFEAVRVWDLTRNKQVASLKTEHCANRCVFSPDGKVLIAAGCSSGQAPIQRWDVAGWQELPPLDGHEHNVTDCAFSADGRYIVSGGDDEYVYLWDAGTGERLRSFLKHRDRVCAVAISPDGKRIASRGDDSVIRVWDADSGEDLQAWQYPTRLGGPLCIANTIFLRFSAGGDTLIVGDTGEYNSATDQEYVAAAARADHGVRMFDISTGKQLCRFTADEPNLPSVLSPDGRLVATVNSVGSVRIWNAWSGTQLPHPVGHEGAILAVALSPDGRLLATGGSDRTVRVWNPDGAQLKKLTGHTGPVTQLRFSADSTHLASASGDPQPALKTRLSVDRNVSWWDIGTGKELREFPGHFLGVQALGLSADGKRLTAVSCGGMRHIWETDTGSQLSQATDLKVPGNSILCTPDGGTVVYTRDRRTLEVLDTSDAGQLPRKLRDNGRRPCGHPVAISPDRRSIVSAVPPRSRDQRGWIVELWDVPSEKLAVSFETREGPEDPKSRLVAAFSHDSRTVAVAYRKGVIALLDAATGEERGRIEGGQAALTCLAFSDDGKRLVSGSEDGTALIWDLELVLEDLPPASSNVGARTRKS
jgi:RNA polymerase sigma factor (sigma-70 family)